MKFFTLFLLFLTIPVFGGEEIKLIHSRLNNVSPSRTIVLKANLVNPLQVDQIVVSYKFTGDTSWYQTIMEPEEGEFVAKINSVKKNAEEFFYYIEVFDLSGTIATTFSTKNNPEIVPVKGGESGDVYADYGNVDQSAFDFYAEEVNAIADVKVESASKQSESLKETPVPVTVITEDMIRLSGINNLKDLLVTYVPGMTFSQDHNEMNVAMRGVYVSSQQKILIMRDGHRLNNRAYSEANPDYSISLENVKQIEVLRGPASSIYGNVALTAVINIITKSGADIQGASVSAGMGNYGQQQINLLYGYQTGKKEKNNIYSLMLFGSIYRTDGQKETLSQAQSDAYYGSQNNHIGESYIINGFDDNPSYDFGLTFKTPTLKITGSMRHSKQIESFTSGGVKGLPYNYDDYRLYRNEGPGLSSYATHLNLSYTKEIIKNLELQFTTFFDTSEIAGTLVSDPLAKKSTFINWKEYSLGTTIQLNKHYKLSGSKGNILVGVNIDYMNLYDSEAYISSVNADTNTQEIIYLKSDADNDNKLLDTGQETIYSAFAQLKHHFSEHFIMNAGFRYDYKDRHKGSYVSDFSPRVALIWLVDKTFDMKFSYARSFVDAPYWYRYNVLPDYKGSENLKPEHLNSFQFTPTITLMGGRLKNTMNFFYNYLTDFIFNDPYAEQKYQNAGKLTTLGFEEELAFIEEMFRFRANFSWQYVHSFEDYAVTLNQVHNVPSLQANFITDVNPIFAFYKNFWLNLTLRYVGQQLTTTFLNNIDGSLTKRPDKIESAFLLNVGVRIGFSGIPGVKNFFIDARVKNLLDTQYEAGGSVSHPYPQAGRWFFIKGGLTF